MSNPPIQCDPRRSGRRAKAILAAAALFLVALAGISVWVVRSFISEPTKIIILPQDMAQQARVASAPRVARDVVVAAPAGTSPAFHGNVVDALSHEPISEFTVHLGYYTGGNSPPYFDGEPAKLSHGGRYTITSNVTTTARWFVRIDASGHMPDTAEVTDKSGRQDFQLQQANDLTGVVLDSSSKLVAGATVAVAVPGVNVNLNTAGPGVSDAMFSTTTDANGRFRFSPQLGPITIAAFNDKEYGQITMQDVGPAAELHLAPWGKIHGLLLVSGAPAAKERVVAQSSAINNVNQPYVEASDAAITDAAGHFNFNRVLPGEVMVARTIRVPWRQNRVVQRLTQSQRIGIAAGQSLNVKLGGVGRPVVGKFVPPPGAGPMKNYFMSGGITGQSAAQWPTLPLQMPDTIKTGSDDARDIWMNFFSLTPAGKQFLATHPRSPAISRQYAAEMTPDNSFRIDDVAPGDYRLSIALVPVQPGRVLGSATTTFTVNSLRGSGYTNQPLILPDITFVAPRQ